MMGKSHIAMLAAAVVAPARTGYAGGEDSGAETGQPPDKPQ